MTARGTDRTDQDLVRQSSLRLADGWAGFDGEALYVERDGERTRVAFDDITQVSFEDFDYFLGIISAVLVGFGIYFVPRSPLSLLFSLFGLASLYRLYRHRGAVVVRVENRPKPLTVHPEDGGTFYEELGTELGGRVVSDRGSLFGG